MWGCCCLEHLSQPGWTWVTSQQYVFRGERTSAKEEGSRKDLSPARDQESCKRMMVMAVQKSKRVPEKHLFLLYWLAKAFDCVDHNKVWKILKGMAIPDYLTCLLRNLYAGQEATVRTGHGTTDWFPIGKGAHQGCILSPCLFNLYAEYIMRNTGLDEAQTWFPESRLPGEISITSDMQMTPPLWQKVKKNQRASWWKWKRRVKKLA